MRKRAVSLALCLCMILSLLPVSTLALGKHPFTDVAATDWFNDSVQYVYERGLMNGTTATTFSPDRITSRGMIVTILYRLAGSPVVSTTTSFADVTHGSNYEAGIIWGSENGVVTGYNEMTFGPYDIITHQQIATFLYRYANLCGYDTSRTSDLSKYMDADLETIPKLLTIN